MLTYVDTWSTCKTLSRNQRLEIWRSGTGLLSVYLEMNTRREEWSRCDMPLEGLAVLHGKQAYSMK
jgi:urease accessory protein UreF